LRHVRSLSDREGVVHTCEPETGRNLSDIEDEKRSLEGIKDCQASSEENSDFQMGNEMRSLEDLVDCQEGSTEIPDFQVGMR
jgi:hypothetical protein